jgi:hypothetical protein
MDKLLIERVTDRISINSVLNEEKSKVLNTERTKKPLVFFIRFFLFLVEKNEISFIDRLIIKVNNRLFFWLFHRFIFLLFFFVTF